MSLFGSAIKRSDILFIVEEQGRDAYSLTQRDLEAYIKNDEIADKAVITKISILERSEIVTTKSLRVLNGGSTDDAKA